MQLGVSAVVVLSVLLAGCVSSPEQRRAADEAKCRSYGFTRKNDAFAECLQRIDIERSARIRDSDTIIARPVILYSPVAAVPMR